MGRTARQDDAVMPSKTCGTILCGLALLASFRVSAAVSLRSTALDSTPTDCAQSQRLSIRGGDIRLIFDANEFALNVTQICAWVERSGLAVGNYFDGFPVRTVRIAFEAVDARNVATGAAYGSADGGPLIVIKLGRTADQAALDRDWVMTHEMVHLAVPSVPERSHWLEEGIATYIEPIARAQLGQLSEEKVWNDMVRDMPQGLPKPGDRGLDRTPTWGRTYWGGALFCLLADVEIRQRTNNRMSLRDALRGVLTAGGNIQHDWTPEMIFAAADKATGVSVLGDLYRKMSTAPGIAELDGLWQRLGVSRGDNGVAFDGAAPLSEIREAMTAPSQAAGKRPS